MYLIFNTIIDSKARDHFTKIVAKRITFGKKYHVITLENELIEPSIFSHLLITGSELSASQGSEWDDKISEIIKIFLKDSKPILGICHGHQMIARTICGKHSVCKSEIPEFGWKQMKITNNRLFKNVSQPIFLESRYDEVCLLDDRFEIIASNDQLAIQAFQMKSKPVFGVQFHPEMIWEDGSNILENHFLAHPDDRIFYKNEMANLAHINDNLNIFRNFWQL